MKKVYMGRYYPKVSTVTPVQLTIIILSLALIAMVGADIAGASNKCDGRANLPKRLSHITFTGGYGEGCTQAVVIENAKNTEEGVAAEKNWIKTCYPSAQIKTKAVSHKDGKVYEVVELTTANNLTKQLCFDITQFFGSW
jgi:hypothetical protein